MLCSALEILGLIVPWSFATPTLVQPTPAVPSADNQPQPSSCAQKPLSAPAPSREVFDGTLTCHTETIPRSDPLFYMTKEEASNAINTFCGRIHEGVAFNTNGGVLVQSAQDDGPFGYPMRLSAFWTPGDRTDCPTLDFSNSSSYAVCRQSLKRNIIDECNSEQNGMQFWKGGGKFVKDCIRWEMSRVGSSSRTEDGCGDAELKRL